MQKLTTTIRRDPLYCIWNHKKKVEYREIKSYYESRLASLRTPFLLRLINGMSKHAPELTVCVKSVHRNNRTGNFELHLGKITETKNCRLFADYSCGHLRDYPKCKGCPIQ